ncbi:hypothetical protein [Formicincola oecophyllae]|uniref:hypothetical protein n=1 Tax=Formicincola oecophyllae TaxID=2558361 RepID=UPI0019D22D6E|nr:hypothetical protein [Formicincola oecophyllae]
MNARVTTPYPASRSPVGLAIAALVWGLLCPLAMAAPTPATSAGTSTGTGKSAPQAPALRRLADGTMVDSAFDGATGGSFTVMDERAPNELSEVSQLYVAGRLVATFRLSLNHSRERVMVAVPAGYENVPYSLCGAITVRGDDGKVTTHRITSDGLLHHPDGRDYEAFMDEEFTRYELLDPNDPDSVEMDRNVRSPSRICPNDLS